MAHSPSPVSMTFGSLQGQRHTSRSPPTLLPISKRDKKRITIESKLKELDTTFLANHEMQLRQQLSALTMDIHFITRADPYGNKPLDDGVDDLVTEVGSTTGTGSVDGDSKVPLGNFAARFVEQVNDAMELRDASLTEVDIRHRARLEALQLEHDFAMEVAKVEFLAMKEALRERSISTLRARRKEIQKEKDRLDTADATALLHQNSPYALTQPTSPGGGHSNRKTRHTRHRLDPDDAASLNEGPKRKHRRIEVDHESPTPYMRSILEHQTLFLPDKSDPDALIPSPLTMDRVFTARELATHAKSAVEQTAHLWASKKARSSANGRKANSTGNGYINDDGGFLDEDAKSVDGDVDEDGGRLMAPPMDRTGSHTTRSTRANPIESAILHEGTERQAYDPQRVLGYAVIEAYSLKSRIKDKDQEAPQTTSLSQQENAEDMAFFGLS